MDDNVTVNNISNKASLKVPKCDINRGRTDNTMAKRKITLIGPTVNKELHKKT